MIISLYKINRLVFITETECVYCAVRAEFLNRIQVDLERVNLNIRRHRERLCL